jgi:hypothetical protein
VQAVGNLEPNSNRKREGMKPITPRIHALLDYPLGLVLIAAPWIFGFSDVGGMAVAAPIIIGVLMIGQSMITDWELSIVRVIPLSAHLTMDVVAGAFLAVSPFVFGFSDEGANAWLPHVFVGLGLIAAGLTTQAHPSGAERSDQAHGPGQPG